jgi:TonB family protein
LPSFPFSAELTWDEPPEPVGGFAAIQEKVRYPEQARLAGVEGRVHVIALIDSSGAVVDSWAQPGSVPPGFGLEEAAVSAVRAVRWKPAKQAGKPVAAQIAVPVIFKLSGESAFGYPPTPRGGFQELQRHLVYPEAARKARVEGTVIVQAVIDTRGRVTSATVRQSLNKSCDEAAVAAVKSTRWSPAIKAGKPVEASIAVPVVFRLKPEG